jgi:dTDP-glucose 4,6-dehydratase
MTQQHKTILITGGSGFIGSNLIHYLLEHTSFKIINLDKLTYASSDLKISPSDRYLFHHGDITDLNTLKMLLDVHQPSAIMHLAAESHVDRSIDDPSPFMLTNILGTHNLLETTRHYLKNHPNPNFRFLHVSTDEVFGSLPDTGYFTESTAYDPRSPYSASKASSDLLARAWYHTFGLPILISNCSNNYGPFQHPEKLIPLTIARALAGNIIPVYGNGQNVRDWLYVQDHATALLTILQQGIVGETYVVGGNNERKNIDVVTTICQILDEIQPKATGSYANQIRFVVDRPGHDHRYAIDATKIKEDLGWQPLESFDSGIRKTVIWYIENTTWVEHMTRASTYKRLDVIL